MLILLFSTGCKLTNYELDYNRFSAKLLVEKDIRPVPDTKSKIMDNTAGDRLFIYQGAYESLGPFDEVAELVARHDYAVLTHGFYLDGSMWRNGNCLDVNYAFMEDLLLRIRQINRDIMLFVYVPATADHPSGCWPQPSVQMSECPDGHCADFKTWTNLWLEMEEMHDEIKIDGIFIDLVHSALISEMVRDSIYNYIHSLNKVIMANALSDTIGLKFALSSSFINENDYVFVEGYYCIAGYKNLQTDSMNRILKNTDTKWAALVTETYNAIIDCDSDNNREAYSMFIEQGGTAYAYQSSDLGTLTNTWIDCRNSFK